MKKVVLFALLVAAVSAVSAHATNLEPSPTVRLQLRLHQPHDAREGPRHLDLQHHHYELRPPGDRVFPGPLQRQVIRTTGR